jgi:hypothetical protein
VSSSLGWGKGFGEEFVGMHRKKRNKRSDAHDVMYKTFKLIIHALRLSGINILKNALRPSQLPAPVNSSEEEDMDGSEEEDGHDREEEHAHDNGEDGREQDIGMPTVTKRMKCTVIVDHLCWTQQIS